VWTAFVVGLSIGVLATVAFLYVRGLLPHDVDGDFDERAWRSDLESVSGPMSDAEWEVHVDVVMSHCAEGDEEFRHFNSAGDSAEAGTFYVERRIDWSYACPDRLLFVNDVRADIEDIYQ
jgi:hypothetical protein